MIGLTAMFVATVTAYQHAARLRANDRRPPAGAGAEAEVGAEAEAEVGAGLVPENDASRPSPGKPPGEPGEPREPVETMEPPAGGVRETQEARGTRGGLCTP